LNIPWNRRVGECTAGGIDVASGCDLLEVLVGGYIVRSNFLIVLSV
jgi:hypothetical protein